MRTIRASEIGSFLYCNRAWWYQRQGIASQNIGELTAGTRLHHQHSRSVAAVGCLRSLALVLLLAALVAIVLHFTLQVL